MEDKKLIKASPSKVGRPSNYEPWMCEKMMVAIGVASKPTWYAYRDKHPEFKQAAEAAKLISASVDEHTLEKHSRGEIKGDGKMLAWSMHNKAPDFYDMPNQKAPAITITGSQVVLSTVEIDSKMEQLQAKLRQLNSDVPVLTLEGVVGEMDDE